MHARQSLVAAGLGRRECGSLLPRVEVHRPLEQASRVCCCPAHQAPPVLGVGWRHHVCGAAAVDSQQRRVPGDTAGRPVWPGLGAYMCIKRVRCGRARTPAPARARGSAVGCAPRAPPGPVGAGRQRAHGGRRRAWRGWGAVLPNEQRAPRGHAGRERGAAEFFRVGAGVPAAAGRSGSRCARRMRAPALWGSAGLHGTSGHRCSRRAARRPDQGQRWEGSGVLKSACPGPCAAAPRRAGGGSPLRDVFGMGRRGWGRAERGLLGAGAT